MPHARLTYLTGGLQRAGHLSVQANDKAEGAEEGRARTREVSAKPPTRLLSRVLDLATAALSPLRVAGVPAARCCCFSTGPSGTAASSGSPQALNAVATSRRRCAGRRPLRAQGAAGALLLPALAAAAAAAAVTAAVCCCCAYFLMFASHGGAQASAPAGYCHVLVSMIQCNTELGLRRGRPGTWCGTLWTR